MSRLYSDSRKWIYVHEHMYTNSLLPYLKVRSIVHLIHELACLFIYMCVI